MLLFTLEGFSPAALSCYGASWNRTEAIDLLAAGGTTWDRVITPVYEPVAQLDRWLRSEHFPAGEMVVVTDDERISELSSSDRIGELIVIPPRLLAVAESWEETTLAALAAIAAEQLPENPHVWLHSRFLTQCWDAPRELFPIDQFDEADLEPMDAAETIEHELSVDEIDSSIPAIFDAWQPPDEVLDNETDPDMIMAWMRTYGCQIRLVNAIVGLLSEVAQEAGHAARMVAGTSGFSLGQSGAIGHRSGPLRSCHLHVPMIASRWFRDERSQAGADLGWGIRDRRVHSADTLPEMFSHFASGSKASPLLPEDWAAAADEFDRSVVTSVAEQKTAITTDQWFFVRQAEQFVRQAEQSDPAASTAGHLFLKPDDLNDANDVVRLKPDVAEQLDEKLV